MLPAATKDFEISDRRYQLGRFDAATGSWLFGQLMNRMMQEMLDTSPEQRERAASAVKEMVDQGKKPSAEDVELIASQSVLAMLRAFTRTQHAEAMALCLKVCSRYDEATAGAPVPVMTLHGEWVDHELAGDPVGCLALMTQVLTFNLAPFFDRGLPKP